MVGTGQQVLFDAALEALLALRVQQAAQIGHGVGAHRVEHKDLRRAVEGNEEADDELVGVEVDEEVDDFGQVARQVFDVVSLLQIGEVVGVELLEFGGLFEAADAAELHQKTEEQRDIHFVNAFCFWLQKRNKPQIHVFDSLIIF